jgi:hypothetical protein
LGIGLALAPAALAIGPIDFDDTDLFGLEVPGQSGPIRTGPFDADQLDGAEVAQPPQQFLVAGFSRGEALDAEEGPSFVQSRSYMDVEVRIDAAGDAPWQSGHCHPFVGLGWGDTAPSGTTDRTATGLCEAGSYEVTPSDRQVSSG